jgi:hypothetical protein
MQHLTIRSAFNNDKNLPMCKLWDGTWISFAVIKHNGRNRLVPGTNTADALVNFSKYRKLINS